MVTSFINSFKNFRRKKSPREKKTTTNDDEQSSSKPCTATGKSPGIASVPEQPVVPPGEDTISFERHNKVLQAEFKKTNRKAEVVSDLLDRTFAFRRQDILANTYDLKVLFEKYPFLQECEQVLSLKECLGHAPLP